MRLKVLGCHGSEALNYRTTAFLLEKTILIDAGSCASSLSLSEQLQIDYVFISHSHLDHLKDLTLLADNLIGLKTQPLQIFCAEVTAQNLKKHLFNDLLWPDFTSISNPADPLGRPLLQLNPFPPHTPLTLGAFTFTAIPVSHNVPCQGLLISSAEGTLIYTADTGPTTQLWQTLQDVKPILGLICEVSFPERERALALASGHLTPHLLQQELKKLPPHFDAPIFIYHLKPAFALDIAAEIKALQDPRLRILELLDILDL